MDELVKKLLRQYFSIVAELQDQHIVRSDKIQVDLDDWICVKQYELLIESTAIHHYIRY